MRTKKLNFVLLGIVILSIFILIAPTVSAFSVTGKQIVTIHPGKNIQEVTITNSDDSVLFVELATTKEQYYKSQNIQFSVSENWKEKFDKYEWQRVDWVSAKYSEAIIAPRTTETIRFTINIPENITKGTFYAKLEVKDIGKKEGMIVIRPVYVSQVVARITDEKDASQIPCFGLDTVLLLVLTGLLMLGAKKAQSRKNKKV